MYDILYSPHMNKHIWLKRKEPIPAAADIRHFTDEHFKGITASGKKFVYCPVGMICSWHPDDHDKGWCHFCKVFFMGIA